MKNFSLSLLGSELLFFLLLLALIGLSYFVYRRTNPPVANWLKSLLTTVRVLVLFFILFILFAPILKLTWQKKEQPIVAVLLDTSASMALEHKGESRAQKAISMLKSNILQKGNADNRLDYYQFSYQLKQLKPDKWDSVKFAADGTDLAASLKQLQEQNINNYLKAIILLSDGINNLGENPLRTADDLDLPIYPISVGPVVEEKDLVISKISTNQITYANNEVPVDVTIKANGLASRKIKVDLIKEKTIIDSKYVDIADNLEATVRLLFTPQEWGLQKYQVSLPILEDELTHLNNQKSFYVKVLKSKIKILYFSGSPGADFAFIKRTLDADINIEADYWVAKKGQSYYQGNFTCDISKFKNYDGVVFQNYPPKNFSIREMLTIKNLLEAHLLPILFIAGNNVNYQAMNELKNYLPFSLPVHEYPEFEINYHLTAKGTSHPVVRIDDDELKNHLLWQELPPILYSCYQIQALPGTDVLVEANPAEMNIRLPNQTLPLIMTRKVTDNKAMAIMGYGIWRWNLLMWGIGKSDQLFTQFLNNSFRWLTNKEDSKNVRISPDQEIYRSGQKINFSCQVYNENYVPIDGAEVKISIFNQNKNYEISLSATGEGKYEGGLQALEGGDYKYTGTASYKNLVLGSDEGQFSVENFNLEHLQTKIDEDFLRQLASKTDGLFITDSTLNSLEKALKFPARIKTESREWQLWNKLILLVLVIVLLSIEWFIRKSSGML